MPLLQSVLQEVSPNVVADVAITALLIYWLFSLIRGTRAVRLVIGVCLLLVVYAAAVTFDLQLLRLILVSTRLLALGDEALVLVERIVELGVAREDLHAADDRVEVLGETRVL